MFVLMQVTGGILPSATQLVPAEIKRELDKDVIGQERAKKILSVALHSHMIRVQKAEQAATEQSTRAVPDGSLSLRNPVHRTRSCS